LRGQAKALLVVAALCTFFALGVSAVVAAPASAAHLYRGVVHDSQEADQPRRVAVEQSTGNAFVIEEGAGRVLVLKPSGLGAELLTEFGADVLEAPFGVAIAESGGQTEIYVSDAGTDSIVRFTSDEQPTPTFTIDATYSSPVQGNAADQVQSFASPLALAPDGDLWVADRGANAVKRFDPSGAHVVGSNFDGSTSPEGAFTALLDLAANPAGDLYVIDSSGGELGKSEGTSRVQRFAEDGTYKATLGPLGERNRPAIVAVNPANGDILVSGDQDGISNGEYTPRFFLFDSSNAFIEEAAAGADFTSQGASYRGAAFFPDLRNRFYFVGGPNWFFFTEFDEWREAAGNAAVHVMSEAIPPTVAIDPVSAVGARTATISGEVNPSGIPTSWQVEYKRASAATWTSSGGRSAGDGETPVDVSESLEGLLPGVEYEARLQTASEDGTVESSIVSFTTDTVAPVIVSQTATAGTDGATLRARINPGGEETTYRFEWGPTAAYGESTPAGTIAAGAASVTVSAPITGLTPGATYHFRVVTESAAGEASGDDQTFTTLSDPADSCPNARYRTGSEAQLGDCRAYELVTPIGAQADLRIGGGPATADGGTVCFNTEYPLLDSDPNGIKLGDDGFCAWRGDDGWETKWVTGPAPMRRVGYHGSDVYELSSDGQRVLFASDMQIFSLDFEGQGGGTPITMRSYLWEAGQTRELTPPAPPFMGTFYLPEAETMARRPLAASDDLTRGLFQSSLGILPGDGNFAPDVYEWSPSGLRIVSSDESGAAAGGTVSRGDGNSGGVRHYSGAPGSISADGSRVFFQHEGPSLDADADPAEAPEGVESVYMREGDEVTLVSPRRGSGPDARVELIAASSDGELAFLETTQQLTAEAKADGTAIYRYDVAEDELELIADRPAGVKMLGASADGSTVVFLALASQQAYVLRDGTAHLLGTLGSTDAFMPARIATVEPDRRGLRITPDGSVVVFAASGEFAGATSGVAQIFRWEEGEGLESVSTVGPGAPTQDASIGAYPSVFPGSPREEFLHNHRNKAMDGRIISDDGSRVFFETPEALVERDVNAATDVYEWHAGDIELVSPGTGAKSLYHESSADGKTVFFTTFERVEPEFDINHTRDLYVAQPGGGFTPPPLPPTCGGEACQPGVAAPGAGSPASRSPGDGNVPSAPKIGAFGGKQLSRLAAKGRARIRVTVAMPGRVTALLKGTFDRRTKTVSRAARSVKTAGTVSFTLRLSKAARERLRERGRLRLTLEVSHSQTDQTAKKVVMLRD